MYTNIHVVKDHCSELQNLLLIAHIDEQLQVDVIYDTFGLIITPIYGVNDHICHNRASIGLKKTRGLVSVTLECDAIGVINRDAPVCF